MRCNVSSQRLFNYNFCIILFSNLLAQFGYTMVASNVASYASSLGVKGTLLGLIPGMMSIAALFSRPFTGIICDWMNRKYILVFSLGGLAIVFTGYAYSFIPGALVLVRIFHGIMFGLCTTVSMTMVADVLPEDKLAQGLGYYGLCNTGMGAIAPGIGVLLLENWGYRAMFLLAAAFYFISFAIALLIRYKDQVRTGNKKTSGLSLSHLFVRESVPPTLIGFCNAFTYGAVVSFVLLYASERNISNAGAFFTAYAAVTLASRPFFGRWADRVKPQYLIYPCGGCIILAMLILFFASNAAVFCFAAVIYGIGYGGLQPLVQSMSLRSVKPEMRGAASGTFNLGLDGGNGLGPVVCGTVAGIMGSYGYGFLVLIIPVICGLLIMGTIDYSSAARQEEIKSRHDR